MKEFKAFLKLIKEDAPIRFVQIAQLLDVDPTTITEWNKHPLAQKTVRDKIEKAIKGMEKAGKDDWRMWQRKLKMLGVFPRKRKDVATGGDKIKIVLLRTIA